MGELGVDISNGGKINEEVGPIIEGARKASGALQYLWKNRHVK